MIVLQLPDLETVHKLAVVLRVSTSAVMSGPDAPGRLMAPVRGDWDPVRRALGGDFAEAAEDAPTVGGVRDAVARAVAALLDSRYAELRAVLPSLLRDADALVGRSADGAEARARQVLSDVRRRTCWARRGSSTRRQRRSTWRSVTQAMT
jgi:hypothetical protein